MEYKYVITAADAERVREFFGVHEQSPFVARRRQRNVEGKREAISKPSFWYKLASCLLTTQARSGPDTQVSRLIRTKPFPLSYEACVNASDVRSFVTSALKKFGGVRRNELIGKELGANLALLEGGEWTALLSQLSRLDKVHSKLDEREVARYLASMMAGLGPKQARNVLQSMGLTQFETPIDSRIIKWLRRFGFPVPLSSTALADADYYEFVADGFQSLCEASGILPCLLDAAVFASFDREWTPDEVVW